MFIARIKNTIKWFAIWFVGLLCYCTFYELNSRGALPPLEEIEILLFIAGFIVGAKAIYNALRNKMPWGLRHMQQAQPQQQKKKNKKRGFVGSILNAPHTMAQKGTKAVGNKILNFGSGESSGYNSDDEWIRRKEAADEEVRERQRQADQDVYNRNKNIDAAIYQDYLSKQSPAGSYDEDWHSRQADWYEDEAKKY